MGTVEQVDFAVSQAMESLSGGGFVLAPSDSILDTSENAQRNFYAVIESWKKHQRRA
jgi:hypothetical protein